MPPFPPIGVAAGSSACVIYRSGNAPPAAPDVSVATMTLEPKGQSTLTTVAYTHRMTVPVGTDIRDGHTRGAIIGGGADTVFVPDKNGLKFFVILVRRRFTGTSIVCKEVLLDRCSAADVTWTNAVY